MKIYFVKIIVMACLALNTMSCVADTENKKSDKEVLKSVSKETIKVALLLDTSNSMDGLINQAKAQLWSVVNELSYAKCKGETPNLKIALYEYGNDALSSSNGFIKQVSEFTSDLDEISEHLFGLETNGGEEYCGYVIDTAVKKLEWGSNKDDLKMIFIAGNEPFTQGRVSFKGAIANAKEHGITINTIYCGDYKQGVATGWEEGARLGNGDYMTINHNKKMVHIVTPHDDEIMVLNKKLNKTYVYYGNKGISKYQKQAVQDKNASEVDEEIAVKRAVTKSSKLYNSATWDLVDAAKKKEIKYSTINKKQLPNELQGKSDEEIKAFVENKSKEREVIQKKVQDLNIKRKKYVTKKQSEAAKENELESALVNAIKKQAERKSYTW